MLLRSLIASLALLWICAPSFVTADEEYTPRYTSEFLRGDEMTILETQDRLRMQQLGPAQGGVITDNRHHATLKSGEKVYSYTHVNPADRVTHAYYVLETGAWVNPYNLAEADLISQNWFKGQYLDPMGGGTGYGEAIVRPFSTRSRPYLVVNPAGTHDFYFSYEAVAKMGGIQTKITPHFVKDATVVDLIPCEFVTSCADIHTEIMNFPKCPTSAWYNWFWCNSWYFKQWVKACVYSRLKCNTDEYVNAGGELHNEEHKLTLTVDGYKREALESIAATKNVQIGCPGDTEIVAVTFTDNLKTVDVTFRATTLTTGEKTVVFCGKEVHKRIRFIKPIHDVPDTHVGTKKFAGFRLAGTLAKEPITMTSTGKAIVFADQSYQCWTFSGTRFCSPTQVTSCSYGGEMDGLDYVTCGYTPDWEKIRPNNPNFNVSHCQDESNVCGITSIKWVDRYLGQMSINTNIGSGLRIFPDRTSPLDDAERHIVGVRLKISARKDSRHTLHLRGFDIDDPSANTAPIDRETDAQGRPILKDNRGAPQDGKLTSATVTVTADQVVENKPNAGTGTGEVEFEVTFQPGDNFRVIAQCGGDHFLKDIGPKADDGTNARLYFKGAGYVPHMFWLPDQQTIEAMQGDVRFPQPILATVLLTVWRRLYVEMDSMDFTNLAIENTISGTTVGASIPGSPLGELTTVTINRQLDDENQYRGPRSVLRIGGNEYSVMSNDTAANSHVVIAGMVPIAAGTAFELVDDDDNAIQTQRTNKYPDIGLIQDSDDPQKNLFARAYIRPEYTALAGRDSQTVTLDINVNNAIEMVRQIVNAADAKETSGINKFWVDYLQSGFQGSLNEDADPNDEEGIVTPGESTSSSGTFPQPIRILSVENVDATHARARIRVGLIPEADKGQFTQNINGTNRTFIISRVESYNGDEMIAFVNKAENTSVTPSQYISPVVTSGNTTITATLWNVDASLIYLETITDVTRIKSLDRTHLERMTVAHEVGHQLGGSHEDGDIMAPAPPTPLPQFPRFSDESINVFRRIVKP